MDLGILPGMDPHEITDAATKLADATDSDVLMYNGDIDRPWDDALLDLCAGTNRRANVLLILCSHGGNPDAAYRMARGLQENYERFTVVLGGRCKSAGTLLAIGAHVLAMADHAELGPLDIQLGKNDELFETSSGLTILNALTELEGKAFELFEKTFLRIKFRSEGNVTFKTATHIATELAKGVVAPIMAQIDPLHVGEVSRAMKIGKEYGRRLSAISQNLREDALERLVDDYPSHGFVIDRKEASTLFMNVRETTEDEGALIRLLGGGVRAPRSNDPILFFISETRKEIARDSDNPPNVGGTEDTTRTGVGTDPEALGSKEQARQGIVSEISVRHKTGT